MKKRGLLIVLSIVIIMILSLVYFLSIFRTALKKACYQSDMQEATIMLMSSLDQEQFRLFPNGVIPTPHISGFETFLNEKGQLIDRWKTPYKFSITKKNSTDFDLEVCSAGPDKIFGTQDDIILATTGSFKAIVNNTK